MKRFEDSQVCVAIGRRIYEIRKEKKTSQQKLADEAGVDRAYLSRIENGKQNVSVGVLDYLARTLGVKVSEFFVYT